MTNSFEKQANSRLRVVDRLIAQHPEIVNMFDAQGLSLSEIEASLPGCSQSSIYKALKILIKPPERFAIIIAKHRSASQEKSGRKGSGHRITITHDHLTPKIKRFSKVEVDWFLTHYWDADFRQRWGDPHPGQPDLDRIALQFTTQFHQSVNIKRLENLRDRLKSKRQL